MKILNKYKGEAIYTFANVFQSGASMLMGVVAAACIDPSTFGIYQSFLLIPTYAAFLQLGVFNGLNRNLAFYKSKGDIERMQRCIDTSHSAAILVSIIGLVIGISLFIYYILHGYGNVYLWSSVSVLVILALQPITTHYENSFRSGQEFGRLGNIKNIQSVVFCIFSLLPYILGVFGKIIADIVFRIIAYILLIFKRPYPHKSRGDILSLKDLLSAGFPLLVGGYIWQIFLVSDRTYIASHLSSEEMGLYTIAGYVISLFMVLPTALNTLLYPKAASRYGATGDKKQLLPFWKKSIILFTAVIVPLSIVLYFILPYCIELFLPRYVGGIKVAQISLLTCLTFISMGPSVIFGTLKKNLGYITAVLISWGLFWLIVTLFPANFSSIESVAYLRFVISALLMIYIIVHTYILIQK